MDPKDIDFKNATEQFLTTVPSELLPEITNHAASKGQSITEFIDQLVVYGFVAWKDDNACKAAHENFNGENTIAHAA
tara:strand:- start:1950 stop:2180 length:231 start_codon:yes stop_codon:yes gene_type:complete